MVALTPGVVLAGGGHWMIGREDTAKTLFWAKLGGLAGIFAGGAAVATSGASELITPWAIPALIVSGAAFVIPTALDLVGVWSDPKAPRTPSAPRLGAPLLYGRGQFIVGAQSAARETSLVERHLLSGVSVAHDLGLMAYRLRGSWADEQARYEAHGEVRLTRGQGWGLWSRVGLTSHLMTRRSLSLHQGELSFVAPLRFGALIGPTLSSMSAQVSVGWSGGALNYAGESSDAFTGVIGGFRLVHHSDRDRTRVSARYEHRHDDWVGGSIVTGLGSGILGYISAGLHRKLWDALWVSAEASFGSAHIYTLNLDYVINGGAR